MSAWQPCHKALSVTTPVRAEETYLCVADLGSRIRLCLPFACVFHSLPVAALLCVCPFTVVTAPTATLFEDFIGIILLYNSN